ncbi:hypothetical protein TUMEXPCC7403_01255 [Tumidithrix helvetica PCC 7403]
MVTNHLEFDAIALNLSVVISAQVGMNSKNLAIAMKAQKILQVRHFAQPDSYASSATLDAGSIGRNAVIFIGKSDNLRAIF